jgi:BirA family biotin operon repressor/biotin-[acetyl-CoA-carboxylase] ligase
LVEVSFDAGACQSRLDTRWVGRPLVALRELASTNDAAWESLAGGAPNGLVIVADVQTRGRGRAGRTWHQAPGRGLALSVLMLARERFPLDVVPLLAGLALAEGLESLSVGTELKWPNDLLIRGRKAAGVLCESRSLPSPRPASPRGGSAAGDDEETPRRAVVIGAGVNVAECPEDFPPGIAGSATSLLIEGRDLGREEVAAAFLNRLERLWVLAEGGGSAPILREWRRRAVFWGRRVQVNAPSGRLAGVAEDLDPEGRLVVRLDDGSRTALVAGDIELEPGTRIAR